MNDKLRKAGIIVIILGIISTGTGIVLSIAEFNTIGFAIDEDTIIINDPDNPDEWILIIDDVIASTYTVTTPITDTNTPTDPPIITTPIQTTAPPIIVDLIVFSSLTFTLIDEYTVECAFGFDYTEHDIKEAQISFTKDGNQIVDENGDAVFLDCDKTGVRDFKTTFDWWSFPEGTIDVDITIKFDVYIDGVKIPELEDTLGFYNNQGTVEIPAHDGEKPSGIPEYHIAQGIGRWLSLSGIAIIGVGIYLMVKAKKK